MATDDLDGTISRLKKENDELKAAIEDYKSRLETAEALLADLPAGHTLTADVTAIKRAGQARDQERQRQGTLSGEEIGAGMKAIVKRVRRLED